MVGEVSSVRDALVQIVLRLRDDVLKDRDAARNPSLGSDSMYSGGTGLSVPPLLSSVPPVTQLGYDQRADTGSGLGMISSSSLYGYGSLPVCHCLAYELFHHLHFFVVDYFGFLPMFKLDYLMLFLALGLNT